jgi:hypothetical protein
MAVHVRLQVNSPAPFLLRMPVMRACVVFSGLTACAAHEWAALKHRPSMDLTDARFRNGPPSASGIAASNDMSASTATSPAFLLCISRVDDCWHADAPQAVRRTSAMHQGSQSGVLCCSRSQHHTVRSFEIAADDIHRQGNEPECEKFLIENAVLFIDTSVIMDYRLLVDVHSQQIITTSTTSFTVLSYRSLVLSIFTFLWSIRIVHDPSFVKPGIMHSVERFLHACISSLKDRTSPQRDCDEMMSMILRVVGIGYLLDPCWHRAVPSHLSDPSSHCRHTTSHYHCPSCSLCYPNHIPLPLF